MSKLEPLRAAVAVSPDNVPLLLLLANACMEEWSLEEGRDIFDRILRIDPARMEAKLGIAKILHLSGKTSEAIVRTEAVTRDHPGYAPAWIFLSRLNLGDGNREQAQANYEEALKLDPVSKDTSLERDLFSGGAKPAPEKEEPEKVPVMGDSWGDSGAESSGPKSADIETPKMNFDDVGGMDAREGGDPDEDHLPAAKAGAFPRLWQEDRRRRAALRPSGLRQDDAQPRDRGGDQGEFHLHRHPPDPRPLPRQQRKKSAPAFSNSPATTRPPFFSSTRSMPSPQTATT